MAVIRDAGRSSPKIMAVSARVIAESGSHQSRTMSK